MTGVGLGAGAVALYRGAKGVAKQNVPFRRQWEEHLLATVEALNDVADRGEELPLIYVALGDSAAQFWCKVLDSISTVGFGVSECKLRRLQDLVNGDRVYRKYCNS